MSDSMSNGDGDDIGKQYEGYADYQSVSNRVAASIDDAIDAYAYIKALHTENARVRQRQAAEARSRIHSAAIKLLPELRANSTGNGESEDTFEEILNRWVDGDDEQSAYLDRLDEVQLQHECPSWLGQLVRDIRIAGWEIGYLQAGRTVEDDELEPAEEQARQMFK